MAGAAADITLGNAANNFVGAVNSNGANVALADGTGGIILNTTTATGALNVTSTGGAITDNDIGVNVSEDVAAATQRQAK